MGNRNGCGRLRGRFGVGINEGLDEGVGGGTQTALAAAKIGGNSCNAARGYREKVDDGTGEEGNLGPPFELGKQVKDLMLPSLGTTSRKQMLAQEGQRLLSH